MSYDTVDELHSAEDQAMTARAALQRVVAAYQEATSEQDVRAAIDEARRVLAEPFCRCGCADNDDDDVVGMPVYNDCGCPCHIDEDDER
jgi:hypothetical protein